MSGRFFGKSEVISDKDKIRLLKLMCITLDELRYAYAGEYAMHKSSIRSKVEEAVKLARIKQPVKIGLSTFDSVRYTIEEILNKLGL